MQLFQTRFTCIKCNTKTAKHFGSHKLAYCHAHLDDINQNYPVSYFSGFVCFMYWSVDGTPI